MSSAPNTSSPLVYADNNSNISEHARTLASTLSGHMGINEAIRVCEDNQWHGVLAALRQLPGQHTP